jgi:hypothetical protein
LSWVYLQPTGGGSGTWATVTSVNPYQVQFTVPTVESTTTYQVWVNNGLGGNYSWSEATDNGSPMILSVAASAPTFPTDSGHVINVTAYGATGNGTTDDGPDIEDAIAALGANDTLYFPTGTYLITGGLQLALPSDRILVKGDGPSSSIIKFDGASSLTWSGSGLVMDGLTIEQEESGTGADLVSVSGNSITLDNVNLNGDDQKPLGIAGSQGVTVENSALTGGVSIDFIGTSNLFVNNDTFTFQSSDEEQMYFGGDENMSITNNTDSGSSEEQNFVESNFSFGYITHEYVAGNVLDLSSPGDYGNIMNSEGDIVYDGGTLIAATPTTLTYDASSLSGFSDWAAIVITGGAGVGQERQVVAVTANYSGSEIVSVTVTLDSPWNVMPTIGGSDASGVSYSATETNSVYYDNSITSNYDTDTDTAQPGCFELFCGGIGVVIDGNTTDNNVGVALSVADGGNPPLYFDSVINNEFENANTGVAVWNGGIGLTIRNNTITTTNGGLGIDFSGAGSSMELAAIEHNSISAQGIGLLVGFNPLVLAYDNTFNYVDDSPAWAAAIDYDVQESYQPAGTDEPPVQIYYDSHPVMILVDNSFSGYGSSDTYGISVQISENESSETSVTLPLWDIYPGSTSWTASNSGGSSWISFPSSSGTESAGGASGAPVITVASGGYNPNPWVPYLASASLGVGSDTIPVLVMLYTQGAFYGF